MKPLDRSLIMRRAHESFRFFRRIGASKPFAQCLCVAWAQAKRERAAQHHHSRRAAARPFPRTPALAA